MVEPGKLAETIRERRVKLEEPIPTHNTREELRPETWYMLLCADVNISMFMLDIITIQSISSVTTV